MTTLFTLSNITVEKFESSFDGIYVYYTVKFDFTFNKKTSKLSQCIFKDQTCIESLAGTRYYENSIDLEALEEFTKFLEDSEYDFYGEHHSVDSIICEELQKHINTLNLEF